MNKKQIVRTIVFFILLFGMLIVLCDLFEYKISNISRRYEKFKDLEDDTVDAVFVGSSGVDRYWIAAQAYEDYGMTVYPISSEGANSWLIKNLIVEAVSRQNPKLILIDSRPFTTTDPSENISLAETRARRITDMLPFLSLNRLDAVNRTMKYMHEIDPESSRWTPSYYFSFIRFHNKWSDETFTFDELNENNAKYLGYYLYEGSSIKKRSKSGTYEFTNERLPLADVNLKALNELLEYIEENNINVLFVDTPYPVKEEGCARRNTFYDILDEHGIGYINYNTPEMLDVHMLDGAADFYNSNHVNYYGATKFTTWFSEYLNENYDFVDHRNDEAVKKDWDGVNDLIKKRIKTFEKNKAKKG